MALTKENKVASMTIVNTSFLMIATYIPDSPPGQTQLTAQTLFPMSQILLAIEILCHLMRFTKSWPRHPHPGHQSGNQHVLAFH